MAAHLCREYPCPECVRPVRVGTHRNTERSGRRHVTELSRVARGIDRVRHVDIDLTQYCPQCKRPQVFAEVKRYLVSDAEWEMVRRHAEFWGHDCIAILVVETLDGIGVKVYHSEKKTITPVVWGGEPHLIRVLEHARNIHNCW